MPLARLNGATCPATAGNAAETIHIGRQGQAPAGVILTCPTVSGTPLGNGIALLHQVNYSALEAAGGPNTIPENEAGALSILDRGAGTISFAPGANLTGGESIGFDVRWKDGPISVIANTQSNLPASAAANAFAYVRDTQSIYKYEGGAWANKGSNYEEAGILENRDSFILFQIQAAATGGGTGTGTGTGSGVATLNRTAWAAQNDQSNRRTTSAGVFEDITAFVQNPTGAGELQVTGTPVSVGLTEIQTTSNNGGRWGFTINKTTEEPYHFPFDIRQ